MVETKERMLWGNMAFTAGQSLTKTIHRWTNFLFPFQRKRWLYNKNLFFLLINMTLRRIKRDHIIRYRKQEKKKSRRVNGNRWCDKDVGEGLTRSAVDIGTAVPLPDIDFSFVSYLVILHYRSSFLSPPIEPAIQLSFSFSLSDPLSFSHYCEVAQAHNIRISRLKARRGCLVVILGYHLHSFDLVFRCQHTKIKQLLLSGLLNWDRK